jgi:L-asparaginase
MWPTIRVRLDEGVTQGRASRVDKVSIGEFEAFDSPNYPPLGKAGISWDWRTDRFWPETKRPTIWPEIPSSLPRPPWVLPWLPGMDFMSMVPVLEHQWAVVIEAFGTGNIPLDAASKKALTEYIGRGGIVFLRSQVRRGRMALEAYAPGKAIKEIGIQGARDMTREAMVIKLMVLKGLGLKGKELIQRMTQSLVGELTE